MISLSVWCLPRLLLVPLRGHCVTMPPNSCGVGVPDSSLLPRWGLGMRWEQMTEQRHSCAGKGRVYFHAACPDLCPRPGGMESCGSAGGPGRLQPPSQRHPGGMCLPRGHVTGPVSPLPRYLMALASFRWGCSRSTFPRGQGGSVAATGVPRPLCFRGGWRWMQLPALPSLSLIRWLIPMSPRGSGRGSSGSSGAGSGFSVLHPGCPRRGQAGTGACPPSPGHPSRAQAWQEGLDVAQDSWRAAAAAAPLGRGPAGGRGPQHHPGDHPHSPASALLTAPGGPWRGQPFSGRCRGTGRVRRLPAAGPGGSAAAPPAQPHVLLPAASVGTHRRAKGSVGVPQTPRGQGPGAMP